MRNGNGSILLKVSGFVMAGLGVCAFGLGVLILCVSGNAGEGSGAGYLAGLVSGAVPFVILMVLAVILIGVGLMGIKNWNNPAMATQCATAGGIVLGLFALQTLNLIVSGGGYTMFATGLLLPVFYILGAMRLKGAGNQL